MLPARSFPVLILILLCSLRLSAQPVWMPDAAFTTAAGARFSLYESLNKGKAVVLAIGNIRSTAAQELIESQSLQRMAREYGTAHALGGQAGFGGDIRVVFLHIRPATDHQPLPDNLPFELSEVPDTDPLVAQEGWKDLIRDGSLPVYALLPDHLAYPLESRHADDWYARIRELRMRLAPGEAPDVRLLHATTDQSLRGTALELRFQNYSTRSLRSATITLLSGGKALKTFPWKGDLSPLEATSLALPLEAGLVVPELRVVVSTPGEADPTNNEWTLADVATPQTTGANIIRLREGVLKIDFAHRLPGQTERLPLGTLAATGAAGVLSFQRAHAPSSPFDRSSIELVYSTDNGNTWSSLGRLEGPDLATAPQQSYTYIPKAEDWKRTAFQLPAVKAGTSLQLAVIATADFTNDAWLADVSAAFSTEVASTR